MSTAREHGRHSCVHGPAREYGPWTWVVCTELYFLSRISLENLVRISCDNEPAGPPSLQVRLAGRH